MKSSRLFFPCEQPIREKGEDSSFRKCGACTLKVSHASQGLNLFGRHIKDMSMTICQAHSDTWEDAALQYSRSVTHHTITHIFIFIAKLSFPCVYTAYPVQHGYVIKASLTYGFFTLRSTIFRSKFFKLRDVYKSSTSTSASGLVLKHQNQEDPHSGISLIGPVNRKCLRS